MYGEHLAKIAIDTLEIIDGEVPERALRLVREWAALHQQELRAAFELAEKFQTPNRIEPLA